MPMIVVPASMREDPTGNDQPLDRAWTIRTNGMRVPASMREEVNGIVQPLDSAGSTIKSDAIEVVPAPMSEDVNGGESPHEYAGTNRLESIKVSAPMREDTTRNAQPLDSMVDLGLWFIARPWDGVMNGFSKAK